MLQNIGFIDRILRLLLAAALLYLGLILNGGSILGIGLGIVSVILALTTVLGFCPLYQFLGIQTVRSD